MPSPAFHRIPFARLAGVLAVLLATAACARAPAAHAQAPVASPFDGSGMWIWYVSKSEHGSVDAIAARAHASGVTTVFVKSSDGTTWWPQFSPGLVQELKARGLHVCAWQYVYGNRPVNEARLGRRAVQTGADCLVIDAESQYEGKYSQASTYVSKLRAYVGADYPVGLAGFPYVDYHPAFPYSVFLGPGGAQFNLPQMYWRDIGTSVDAVFSHTYLYNSVYGRPVYPLGQLYNGPRRGELLRFRQLAQAYGARGTSWWDWQETTPGGWGALAAPFAPLAPGGLSAPTAPLLRRGMKGDLVVWAQQHLLAAGQRVRVNGVYDSRTAQAVRRLQSLSTLPLSGAVDPITWDVLLSRGPAKVRWRSRAVTAAGAVARRNGPRSAFMRARRVEIRPR